MNVEQIIGKDIYDAYKPINNTNEFMDGMRDAKEGLEHKMGMGEDYTRGFSAQYQAEQNRAIYR